MAEEERGFVIRDRRGRGAESERPEASGEGSAPPRPSEKTEQAHAQHVPPVNFLSFIYSMGTSALMLLGESPEPGVTGPAPNLPHAQEIIDILTMLESKTKGNLTQEEETLLEEMLYTLRVKFVEKAGARKP